MCVRNFFTKAVAQHTGCFAFFNGSVLDVEAHFRASFEWNNFFYLKIEECLWVNPCIRVKCFLSHGGLFLREVELYNPESGLYEPVYINDKDRAFLRHIIRTCSVVIDRAAMQWRNSIDYFPF